MYAEFPNQLVDEQDCYAVEENHLLSGDLSVDFDSTGRLDSELIARLVPELDAEFCLCGPMRFMGDLMSGLLAAGVRASRVHTESFVPAGAGS